MNEYLLALFENMKTALQSELGMNATLVKGGWINCM